MPSEKYRQVLRDLCELARIADPALVLETGSVTVGGVGFTLSDRGVAQDGSGEALMVYCDFGEAPEKDEAAVLRRLMEVNLFLWDAPLASGFCINPDTGRVVLGFRTMLAETDAAGLARTLELCAQEAERWRKSYFLGKAADESGTAARTATALHKRMGSPAIVAAGRREKKLQ